MAETATSTEGKAPKKEAESVLVTMQDGRKVEFVGKRKMLKDGYVDENDKQLKVRFDFVTGDTRTFTIPPSLYQLTALHGASQKIGDETAGAKSVDDMIAAVDSIVARLAAGPDGWYAPREAGSGFAGAGIVVRALMEAGNKTREEVNAWIEAKLAKIEGLTRAKLYAQLRGTDRLRPIIQRLEDEQAKKNAAGGEDLLNDLDA